MNNAQQNKYTYVTFCNNHNILYPRHLVILLYFMQSIVHNSNKLHKGMFHAPQEMTKLTCKL